MISPLNEKTNYRRSLCAFIVVFRDERVMKKYGANRKWNPAVLNQQQIAAAQFGKQVNE